MNRDDIHKKIGEKIRKHRKLRKLSIAAAAKAYGCTPKRWVLLEVGNAMAVDSLLRAAQVLKIAPWKLLK